LRQCNKEIIRRSCDDIGIDYSFPKSYITYQEIFEPGLDSCKQKAEPLIIPPF